MPTAQEPDLLEPFDFTLISNAVSSYFGDCGAVPEYKFDDKVVDKVILNSLQTSPLSEFEDDVSLPDDSSSKRSGRRPGRHLTGE